MPAEMENFDPDAALLLMYLADELPPRERANLEIRLRQDRNLAAQLDSLRLAQEKMRRAMQALDYGVPHRGNDPAATALAQRAVQQWAAERLARPKVVARPKSLVLWWSYPLAAAAAILVAVVFWGLHKHDEQFEPSPSPTPSSSLADNTEPTTAPVTSPLTELTDQQQQELLEAVSHGGAEPAAESGASLALDQADLTIAALQNSQDSDHYEVGLDDLNQQEQTRTP